MGECSCIYDGGYDPPQLYKESIRTARKGHVCGECSGAIKPGDEYEFVFGVWDDKADTQKTCSDCLSVRDEFFCDGWSFGNIWERVGEHVSEMNGEISGDCLSSLTPGARAMVCECIEEVWKELNDVERCEECEKKTPKADCGACEHD